MVKPVLTTADELLEHVKDKLSMAIQADWEQGAAWLNEIKAASLSRDWPSLSMAIEEIMQLHNASHIPHQNRKSDAGPNDPSPL